MPCRLVPNNICRSSGKPERCKLLQSKIDTTILTILHNVNLLPPPTPPPPRLLDQNTKCDVQHNNDATKHNVTLLVIVHTKHSHISLTITRVAINLGKTPLFSSVQINVSPALQRTVPCSSRAQKTREKKTVYSTSITVLSPEYIVETTQHVRREHESWRTAAKLSAHTCLYTKSKRDSPAD